MQKPLVLLKWSSRGPDRMPDGVDVVQLILRMYLYRVYNVIINKANLRDLIAATGLVISNWIQIVNFSTHVTMKFNG